MLYNHLKTILLLGTLGAILVSLGGLIGGTTGIKIALVLAMIMNCLTYWFGDRIALAMYGATPLNKDQYQSVYNIVNELANTMALPTPTLWIVESSTANAFATGRSPQHASIAVTTRIMEILDHNELRGVLAHELAHIKNRDMLITTIAAIMASAIMFTSDMIRYSFYFSSYDNNKKNNGSLFYTIALMIIAPIAATLLQLAVSRSREYLADETGSHYCKDPLALATALNKLQNDNKNCYKEHAHASPMNALCIINPLISGETLIALFQTHPPIRMRIERLHRMYEKMF